MQTNVKAEHFLLNVILCEHTQEPLTAYSNFRSSIMELLHNTGPKNCYIWHFNFIGVKHLLGNVYKSYKQI